MLKLFFWLRYLKKRRIILLSVAAVALSVALLVVVSSLFGGFIDKVKDSGSEVFGDIYLNPWTSIPQYTEFIDRLEEIESVQSATAVLETYGLLRLDVGNIKPVQIIGIDPVKYSEVTNLEQSMLFEKGSLGWPDLANGDGQGDTPAFVGIGVLASPDRETDDYDFESIKKKWLDKELLVTTGVVTDKGSGDDSGTQKIKQRHLKFKVADIVFTGMFGRDRANVFLPIEKVRSLAGTNARHERVLIRVTDGTDTSVAISEIRKVWQEFAAEKQLSSVVASNPQIQTSEQLQKYYLIELQKQMDILMLIFGIVCSAAVMLILCILYMIVMTRQKDIAVIKSCGAGKTAIVSIFLGFGGCIGVAGSVLGVIIGYLFIRNINIVEELIRVAFGIKLWKSSIYMFTKIPNQLDFTAAGWVMAAAVTASVIGAFIPAVVAARSNPVKILRYE